MYTLSCADPEGGTGGPLENHKNIGVLAILVRILLKSQGYQANIQCWALMGTPAKRHLNEMVIHVVD